MPDALDAHEFAAAQFRQSIETPTRFFAANADAISQASYEMARRFERGGRLLVFGTGASATGAQHVSVEFVHPVIVGKRALPAIALTNDIALGLTVDGGDGGVWHALAVAGDMKMLTIGMCGSDSPSQAMDFCFAVPSENPSVVQEAHATIYHALIELTRRMLDERSEGNSLMNTAIPTLPKVCRRKLLA